MVLIVGLGTVFTIFSARESVRAEIRSSVQLALHSVRSEFADQSADSDTDAFWRKLMTFTKKWRHSQIQLILPSGEKIDLPGNNGVQPRQRAPSWFAWWITPEPQTEVLVIRSPQGPFQILIKDDPDDEIAEAWGEAKGLFGLISLQALLVGLFVQATLGRALRPLPMILNGFENIENGVFGARLPDFPVREFQTISRAFNHTASTLEKAHRQNCALTGRMLTLQEEERRSLARELHDELGQSLTGIKVTAGSIGQKCSECRKSVESILSVCDHLFWVLRSIMRRLRPTVLDELGLGAALDDMIANWRERNPDTEVKLWVDTTVGSSNGAVTIQLYRIIQESLNNVAKHANAKNVRVYVGRNKKPDNSRYEDPTGTVRLEVSDDGDGLNPEFTPTGFGIIGMRERAESLGGKFSILNQSGGGASILVDIPIHKILQ